MKKFRDAPLSYSSKVTIIYIHFIVIFEMIYYELKKINFNSHYGCLKIKMLSYISGI